MRLDRLLNRMTLTLSTFLIVLGGLVAPNVQAETATLMNAQLSLSEPGDAPGLYASTAYEFNIPQALDNALKRGVPLYFVHAIRISKDRWYWFDRKILESRHLSRLSFNPITERYQLSYNGLNNDFDSLKQVIPYIKNNRHWQIAASNVLAGHPTYHVETRFYLDTSKLPKPMQVTAAGSQDWNIASEWEPVSVPASITEAP